MFFDLNLLKALGVDLIAIMVHSYRGRRGAFENTAGSSARFVMGDASSEDPLEQAMKWGGAETVDYIDIDELRGGGPPAALIALLYLESMEKVVLPPESVEHMKPCFELIGGRKSEYPGADGAHFNLAVKKAMSTCDAGDCDIGDSVCDIQTRFLNMGSSGCKDAKGLSDPKPTLETQANHVDSLNVVNSEELGQPKGAVLDPLDLLAPPPDPRHGDNIAFNPSGGVISATSGQSLDFGHALEAVVDKQTTGMSQDKWLQEMLTEFPGGIPGSDTLCGQ